MIRVGRFELDASHRAAVRWLVRAAWVPRGARERAVTRALAAFPALARGPLLAAVGAPSPVHDGAPSHADAEARARALGATSAPVSIAAGPGAPPRRIAFGFGDGPLPRMAVKLAAAPDAALALEADALRALAPWPLVPRVLEAGARGVAMTALGGEPLLRRHRMAPEACAWSARTLGACGAALGAVHARGAAGTGPATHGDAWSRNVLVGADGLVSGLVDWEAAGSGTPAGDAAHFLLASADADLAGRGPRAEAERRDGTALVRRVLAPSSPVRAASVAFLRAWRDAFPGASSAPDALASAFEALLARRGTQADDLTRGWIENAR